MGNVLVEPTYWAKIYASGPIDIAKQILRREFLNTGWCVTIEPTDFIYKGGEESGYVIGIINYPRFPQTDYDLWQRSIALAETLLNETYQFSILIMGPSETMWITKRDD